jgi:predicted helicase
MSHLINKDNISLLTCKQQSSFDFQHVFLSKIISDICALSSQTKETGYVFPLYIYPDANKVDLLSATRTPNLNVDIVQKISQAIGLLFVPEKQDGTDTFAPIDLLDYIYAVLHSPNYRDKYKEFLKIDFPRVPYPDNQEQFWQLAALGAQLRQTHLLENPALVKAPSTYPINGDNVVTKPRYENGCVYINATQYFTNVPESVWAFYIGGYQPAQKWLKDRRERTLSFEDIVHYQKIITALTETEHLMESIAKII